MTSAAASTSVASANSSRPVCSMHASISVLVAAASSAAPAPSSGTFGGSTSTAGSRSCSPISAIAPTGRLTKNTQRQLAPWTSAPPSNGPMIVATANVAAM